MDPSLLNFPGPSTYRLPPSLQHQQHPNSLPGQPIHPGHLQNSHPHIHSSGQSHLPNNSQYSLPPSGTTSFPSTPSSSSSRAPDVESTEGPDIPSDPRGAPTTGPLVEPHQELDEFLESFWMRQMDGVEREEQDGKVNVSLPLARIKKVMKSDEEVKMISAEVPIMFSKACEVFISELTCRAWLIAESHKRRTLQKSDVAAAIAHSDMFDFLIDIVPRDGDNPDTAGDGAESKAQSVGDDEGQEDGEEDAEDMYREYVDGDG